MQVCLIIPPSAFLLDERVFPSLGILRVAATLEQAGHGVEVLDLSGVENYADVLSEYLRRTDAAENFGITVTTPQFPAVVQIVRRIRGDCPGARIVVGGPHVTLTRAAVNWRDRAATDQRAARAWREIEAVSDVQVTGDGEAGALAAFMPGARGLINGDDRKSPLFMGDDAYDASPWPARHLIDLPGYRYRIDGFPASSLIGQLGCPFECGFCGGRNSNSLRVTRKRSIENVVAEIEYLHRHYGYTGFMFYDDELNINRRLFLEMLSAIRALQDRLGVEFRLRGFVKAELFSAEQAEAMYRAGFRWLLCGFESADERVLLNINKRATRDDNSRVFDAAHEAGLKIKALMCLGHPGDSAATARAARDWLVTMGTDDFDCAIVTPYPGTDYHDRAVETAPGVWTYTAAATGDRLHSHEVSFSEKAQYYKGSPDGGYRSYVFTDHASAEELVALRDWIEHDTRATLKIPFNSSKVALQYDHSMGMGLPPHILKTLTDKRSQAFVDRSGRRRGAVLESAPSGVGRAARGR